MFLRRVSRETLSTLPTHTPTPIPERFWTERWLYPYYVSPPNKRVEPTCTLTNPCAFVFPSIRPPQVSTSSRERGSPPSALRARQGRRPRQAICSWAALLHADANTNGDTAADSVKHADAYNPQHGGAR